jgi:glutamine amidotransferase-like uncharacterized protein
MAGVYAQAMCFQSQIQIKERKSEYLPGLSRGPLVYNKKAYLRVEGLRRVPMKFFNVEAHIDSSTQLISANVVQQRGRVPDPWLL